MLVGEHDFATRLCQRYDLSLGLDSPSLDEWPRIETFDVLEGHGTVGATPELIEEFYRSLATGGA